MKLYLIRTVLDSFLEHRCVSVTWYRGDRAEPLGPYEEMVQGYATMNAEFDQGEARDQLDEMMTEEEADAALTWLRSRGGTHRLIPYLTPIRARGKDGTTWIPLSAVALGGPVDVIEPNWGGPFKLCGFFDLRGAASGRYVDDLLASPPLDEAQDAETDNVVDLTSPR